MSKIKIRKLKIKGFRGIRHSTVLDLTKDNNSLIICGANAKGKSSISDAIDWFYTGVLKDLTKEGCSRDDYRHRLLPKEENAVVSLRFSDDELNSDFELDSERKQGHTNKTAPFEGYIIESHDELLILRHDDLKNFVEKTKGEKRSAICKLIGMESWENIRKEAGAVHTQLSKELETGISSLNQRKEEVVNFINTDEYSSKGCFDFAESQLKILGVTHAISNYKDLTDAGKKAKTSLSGKSGELSKFNKEEKEIQEILKEPPDIEFTKKYPGLYNDICLYPEKIIWDYLSQLYRKCIELIEVGQWTQNICPLCEHEIPLEDLIDHIHDHQSENIMTQEELTTLSEVRGKALNEIRELERVEKVVENLKTTKDKREKEFIELFANYKISIGKVKVLLNKNLAVGKTINLSETLFDEHLDNLRAHLKIELSYIKSIKKTYEVSEEELDKIEAIQKISTLESHMSKIMSMESELGPIINQTNSLSIFNTHFEELRRDIMGEVLTDISSNVTAYFLELHPVEGFENISLKFLPEDDGVEFFINYKKEEICPPRIFLSESYLNSLGVCLFLATVRAFNIKNQFLILDDIVNSFDANHRANLARLLVNEFKDYQLIILTHDEIWYEFIRRITTKGWQYKRILNWTYETGIDLEDSQDNRLADCQLLIDQGRTELAATEVRKYIEFSLKSIIKKTGCRLRFREGLSNERRNAGELMFELKRYLKKSDFFKFADEQFFLELEGSNFFVNYGSHDKTPIPSDLSIGDIKFALSCIKIIEDNFICPGCDKKLWHIVDQNYSMQCKCGEYSI